MNGKMKWFLIILIVVLQFVGCSMNTDNTVGSARSAVTIATIYDDGILADGWSDYSSTQPNYDSTTVLHDGDHTIAANLANNEWFAIISETGVSGSDALEFYVNGGTNDQNPEISLQIRTEWWGGIGTSDFASYCTGGIQPATWTHCHIPWSIFGAGDTPVVRGVTWYGAGKPMSSIYFARVEAVSGEQGTGGAGGTGGIETGGLPTGGVETGGLPTGGVETGGLSTGGVETGGVETGGVVTGGIEETGGLATGGVEETGGLATGGVEATGGSGCECAQLLPEMGAHTIAGKGVEDFVNEVATPPVNTQIGSMFIASTGRGDFGGLAAYPPHDNKGNQAVMLGDGVHYVRYPTSGSAMFTFVDPYYGAPMGGDGHIFDIFKEHTGEGTVIVVEAKNTDYLQDVQQTYVPIEPGFKITSPSVTTTGPAVIVAFAWPDAPGPNYPVSVTNGFQILDNFPAAECPSVAGTSASKDVTAAETVNVTWTFETDYEMWGANVGIVVAQKR